MAAISRTLQRVSGDETTLLANVAGLSSSALAVGSRIIEAGDANGAWSLMLLAADNMTIASTDGTTLDGYGSNGTLSGGLRAPTCSTAATAATSSMAVVEKIR